MSLQVVLSRRLDPLRAKRALPRLLSRMRLYMAREMLLTLETLIALLSIRLAKPTRIAIRLLGVMQDAAPFGDFVIGKRAAGSAAGEVLEAREFDNAGAAFAGAACGHRRYLLRSRF